LTRRTPVSVCLLTPNWSVSYDPVVHENRDRILLEGEENDESDDDLKNEVFALRDYPDVSESSEEPHETPGETDEPDSESTKPAKSKKTGPKKASLNDAAAPSESSSDETEQFESWGRSKAAYYSTNAAAIGSDDEEAQQLEEAEVLKLQSQARAALDEDDFGVLDAPRELDLTEE
jgi:U3 small nucleolar RNA-associated protein 3